jgi:hypothetical protein
MTDITFRTIPSPNSLVLEFVGPNGFVFARVSFEDLTQERMDKNALMVGIDAFAHTIIRCYEKKRKE